jgi:formylglycine-generating enzyme required for sulfatase activity
MSGNVYEWCWDWYGDYPEGYTVNLYGERIPVVQTDPAGAASGAYRVLRGGSWRNGAQYLRSANRVDNTPSNSNSNYGFRLVRP